MSIGSQEASQAAASLLAEAELITGSRRTVMGFGLGLKHRRSSGYGKVPKPCAKFLVRRKRKTVSERERVKTRISVAERTWPTDIVTAGSTLFEQASPSCTVRFPHGAGFRTGTKGTSGFFVREVERPDRYYLVTAGHVLLRHKASTVRVGDRGVVDQSLAGPVVAGGSYFEAPDGFYDVGLFSVPETLARAPGTVQANLQRVVPVRELFDLWYGGGEEDYFWHPARSQQPLPARMDTLFAGTSTFSVQGRGSRRYGPFLLVSRAQPGNTFQAGDSGSPITTADGEGLMAIHFLASSSVHGRLGYALCAATIMELCQGSLGTELELP